MTRIVFDSREKGSVMNGTGESKKVRFTVEISRNLDQNLSRIADERGVTKAELIRAAARMMAEWDNLSDDGFVVGGWKENPDGSRDTVKYMLPLG